MENSKGGYIIIDISSLLLDETEQVTDIEDEVILKQLLSLSDYALRSDLQLKPIYLRAKDKNGINIVSMCELDKNDRQLRIKALISELVVEILVNYEVEEETQAILIDSASYEVISEANRILKEVESAEEGSIDKVLGLDSNGGLVKGVIESGSKYYLHIIENTYSVTVNSNEAPYTLKFILTLLSKSKDAYTHSSSYNAFLVDENDIILTTVSNNIQVKLLDTGIRASFGSIVYYTPSTSGQTRTVILCQLEASKPSLPPGANYNLRFAVTFFKYDGTAVASSSLSSSTDTVIEL